MAQITIDIPNAQVARINDAFAELYGWNIDSGITKAQFAKARLIEYIKQTIKNSEGNIQERAVRQVVSVEVDNMLIS